MIQPMIPTPEELKSTICGFKGEILKESIFSYIKDLTNRFNCLYVPASGKSPGTICFRCQHGSRDRGKRQNSKKKSIVFHNSD